MTLGDLKALVANFEAADDNIKVVINDAETGRLVELHLHDAAVIGLDEKNRQTSISDCVEKVLHLYVSTD